MTLAWILLGSALICAIALIGGLARLLEPGTLARLMRPLIALAAGTMLGAAFFHVIPQALSATGPRQAGGWILAGFVLFLAIEQLLHWHHAHSGGDERREPVTALILIGDGLHNFLGGAGVAGAFLLDARAGAVAFAAAAAHELCQEAGDYAILVRGGFTHGRALAWNLASAATFPVGAVMAWALQQRLDLPALALFAAGSFLYIAASDLVPEIKENQRLGRALVHLACVIAGIVSMAGIAVLFH
ncbi:MAG: ZIP family metal transporter [Wenzhouxiangellaceae bacterium]|nr:ZIP family metal transporter [Wenzhouxiangellaceae bacterium]